MSAPEVTQKTFGKSTRDVPKEKAQKYYPAEDESKPKKVNIYLQILLKGSEDE
jgi:large subunit ribosomal protein L6e